MKPDMRDVTWSRAVMRLMQGCTARVCRVQDGARAWQKNGERLTCSWLECNAKVVSRLMIEAGHAR